MQCAQIIYVKLPDARIATRCAAKDRNGVDDAVVFLQFSALFAIKDAILGWLEFNVPFRHKYGYISDDDAILGRDVVNCPVEDAITRYR